MTSPLTFDGRSGQRDEYLAQESKGEGTMGGIMRASRAVTVGLLTALAAVFARAAAAEQGYPWSAIGRLERTGGYCTGVLIGRRVVLTAAHCLFHTFERRWLPASSFFFTPGYGTPARGRRSIARDYRIAPGYNPLRRPAMESEGVDLALVLLVEGVGDEAGFIPWLRGPALERTLRGPGGADLLEAGYARNRSYRLTVHEHCRVLEYYGDGNLFLHDCISLKGESGSPLLARLGGQYDIVGIEIGIAGSHDEPSRRWGAAATVQVLERMLSDPRESFAPLSDADVWGDPRNRVPPASPRR